MAIQKHARNLLFYDVIVSRRTEQAPFPKLDELVGLWIEAQNPDYAPKTFEKGMVSAIIKDIAVDPATKTATLLIEVSDKNASNVTYLNHAERSGRHIAKEEPEGNGHAAHIVMSLTAEAGKANTYMTLVEQMPSVSVARIQSTLNSAVRELCRAAGKEGRFRYTKPGGSKKEHPYVPYIMLGGHPSDQFQQDVEEGRINGLQLLKPVQRSPLGQSKHLFIEQYSARINVSKDIPKGERWKTLLGGANLRKDEFPQARIYIQPEREGPSFHIDIDADTGAIISEAYVKSRRVGGFDQLLVNSSPDEIVDHFEKRMKDIVVKERTE